ncbi:ABC transporter substrate-binding protein [Rugosimonospora africana]|uniref:Sugar ABC transporter substrate-binding protein n=1 Tax=Rugosimonospora africana TaxID=556532 RepID=A0A8J3QPX5_9ACTN|nr:ABC transporter substrate-binding protein [Rugosimonospora africana]GIH14117.1 sugar ABC transporter substrate-binding protein [Rugosimonospora africana]
MTPGRDRGAPAASRRAVLRAAGLAGVSAMAGAGCSLSGRATQVAVPWSDGELDQFRAVLRGYPAPVEVVSAGDDIDAFLRARHLAGTSPDVAILSRPGLVTEYAQRNWLAPLSDDLAAPFRSEWSDLLRWNGRLYGAWVKAAFKSLFWYLPSNVDSVPQTWEDLVALVRRMGAAGSGPVPLAIGAADGWVLTDWLENVLTCVAPAGFYDALARGEPRWTEPPVTESLTLLAELWALPGAFIGGPSRALLTQWDESVVEVTTGRAALVFEADYAQGYAASFGKPGLPAARTFRFPSVDGVRPLVMGGDAAVVLHGSRRGEDLIRYLVGAHAFDPWIAAGGYLSPNLGVRTDRYPEGLQRQLAEEMNDAPVLRFDLSDRLIGSFGGADGVGIWRVLQDFFRSVTAKGADRAAVVNRTAATLNQAARRAGGAP